MPAALCGSTRHWIRSCRKRAVVEKLAGGFQFTEGPALASAGPGPLVQRRGEQRSPAMVAAWGGEGSHPKGRRRSWQRGAGRIRRSERRGRG